MSDSVVENKTMDATDKVEKWTLRYFSMLQRNSVSLLANGGHANLSIYPVSSEPLALGPSKKGMWT